MFSVGAGILLSYLNLSVRFGENMLLHTEASSLLQSLETPDSPLCDHVKTIRLALEENLRVSRECMAQMLKAQQAEDEALAAYKKGRYELYLSKLAENGLAVCMRCKQLIPQESIGLIYIDTAREWNSEYSGGVDRSKTLYAACPECIEAARDKSGYKDGECDYFNAYRAMQEDGEYSVRFPAGWGDLPQNASLCLVPEEIIPEHEERLGIPPAITVPRRPRDTGESLRVGNSELKLIASKR